MCQDGEGYILTRRQFDVWPMGPIGGWLGGMAYMAASEGRWILTLVGGVLGLLSLWAAYPKRKDMDRTQARNRKEGGEPH
jgi:hypothetical protein